MLEKSDKGPGGGGKLDAGGWDPEIGTEVLRTWNRML